MRFFLLYMCVGLVLVKPAAARPPKRPQATIRYVTMKDFPRPFHARSVLDQVGRTVEAFSQSGKVTTWGSSKRNNLRGHDFATLKRNGAHMFDFGSEAGPEAAILVKNVNSRPQHFRLDLQLTSKQPLPKIALIAKPRRPWRTTLELEVPHRVELAPLRALELVGGGLEGFDILKPRELGALKYQVRHGAEAPSWRHEEVPHLEFFAATDERPAYLSIALGDHEQRRMILPPFGLVEFMFQMVDADTTSELDQ